MTQSRAAPARQPRARRTRPTPGAGAPLPAGVPERPPRGRHPRAGLRWLLLQPGDPADPTAVARPRPTRRSGPRQGSPLLDTQSGSVGGQSVAGRSSDDRLSPSRWACATGTRDIAQDALAGPSSRPAVERIVVLPLFPQYAEAATGSSAGASAGAGGGVRARSRSRWSRSRPSTSGTVDGRPGLAQQWRRSRWQDFAAGSRPASAITDCQNAR